jgi:hypothetical protein
MGDARVSAAAQAIAYRLDPNAAVDNTAKAQSQRRVTLRPAPEAMTYLSALLPAAQGTAVYAALHHAATRCDDARSYGQAQADTLVERITGRPADAATPIAVNLVVSDYTLLGGDDQPATLSGYGPIPAAVAREMVAGAVFDPRSKASLRRVYARPDTGALVAMESRCRRFPQGLASFIDLRDQRCRTPYCDAPIRHRDHATPHAGGGPTCADNGLGLCESCNYTKETPGWQVTTSTDNKSARHRADFITPAGAHYHSTAPPLPSRPAHIDISEAEVAIAITLTEPDRHAA